MTRSFTVAALASYALVANAALKEKVVNLGFPDKSSPGKADWLPGCYSV
jgi:hypothetical protein